MLDLDITQKELGLRVGISQEAIQKILSGKTKDPKKIVEIAHALAVDAYWLKTGIGEAGQKEPPENYPHNNCVNTINYEAIDFAVLGLIEFTKVYPSTMDDPEWRKFAFKTLYKAWHNEDMRKHGAVPILDMIA